MRKARSVSLFGIYWIGEANSPIIPNTSNVWLICLPGTILMFPVNHDFSQYLDPAHPTRRCCREVHCIRQR